MATPTHQIETDARRRVRLLGALRVEEAGQFIRIPGGKAGSLFAFLVLQPHTPHPREVLADWLWPDAPPNRVRRNLSDLLYRLRQALGPNWLAVDADRVGLQAGPDLWVDVWAFESLSAANDPASLKQAVSLYRGDLLPEKYDDWLLPRRVSLREKYLACLLSLGRLAEHHRRPLEAFEYYHRLVHADPLREEAHRGLMRSLARQGKLADALAAYNDLELLLRQEMGLRPGAATRTLADILRSELDASRAAAGPGSGQPGPAHVSFVGRKAERARWLARLEQAGAGRGGLAILLGEAGIGKTRLLEELDQAAAWRGWQAVWGSGQEFGPPAAFTPLRQALQAALPKPRLQQLLQLVQPIWLSIVAGLAPPITDVLDRPELARSSPDQSRLATAVAHVLRALQQIAPHLLILDDVQWADPALWSLLDQLRPALAGMSVLVVVSGRLSELRAQAPVWSMLRAWDQAGETVTRLRGLGPEELRQLAAAQGRPELTPAQLSELETASGGNPLLALALLSARDLEGLLAEKPSFVELIARRLAALSAEANLALQAAAVIGYQFDYVLWAAVAEQHGLPGSTLPRLAGELEQAGLLVLEADGYRFAYDTLRAGVYAQIPAGVRRQIHQSALAAVARYASHQVLALLHHAEQAGARPEVARYALQAGEQALAGFTPQAAARYFAQALEASDADDLASRYEAVRGRLQALEMLTDREAQRRDLALLQELADRLADPRRQAEAAHRQATFFWMTGVLEQAQALAERGLDLARQVGDAEREAALLETLGRVARDQGDYPRAQALVLQARDLYRALGSHFGEASTTDLLGGLAWTMGDYRTAVERHTAASDLFHELGEIFNEALALNNLGSAYWGLGDYASARSTHQRALALSRELGDRRGEGDNLDNLGGVAWMLGDYPAAIEFYSQALAIRRETDDTWGVSISLGNLGSAYRLLGEYETALAYYAEALEVNRAMGRRRGEGYARHGAGLAWLELGDVAAARQALEAARAIRLELGERDNLMETNAALALLCLAEQDVAGAQPYLRQALQALDSRHDRPTLRQWVHFAAYRVFQAQGRGDRAAEHLRQAADAMRALADTLPAEARAQFLENVPLNRQTRAALAAHSRLSQVRLVRADVPLGRKLSEEDYVQVTWTIFAPEDDLLDQPVARRRHVLKRLLAEAEAQGAAPTDDDLARALGVSRRTILRDMEALARSGLTLPTRRRPGRSPQP